MTPKLRGKILGLNDTKKAKAISKLEGNRPRPSVVKIKSFGSSAVYFCASA